MITIIHLIIFLLVLIGLLLLFNVSIVDIISSFNKQSTKVLSQKELKDMKINAIVPKKLNYLEKRKKETIDIINQGNFKLSYQKLKNIMLGFAGIGVVVGLLLNNPFLSLVLAVGFTYLPTTYLRFKQISNTKMIDSQIQSALSMVTNSYIQHENVVVAVNEVLPRIPAPVDSIFKEFLLDTKLGADPVKGIRHMKEKINNSFFHDWCDDLICCCADRDLKYVLLTHIDKMSTFKSMQAEFDSAMYSNISEFITVAVIMAGIVPLMKLLGDDFFSFYVSNIFGKIEVALAIVVLFVSVSKVINICKPLSQRGR